MSGLSPSESSVQANINEKNEKRAASDRERELRRKQNIIIKSNEKESHKSIANALIFIIMGLECWTL